MLNKLNYYKITKVVDINNNQEDQMHLLFNTNHETI